MSLGDEAAGVQPCKADQHNSSVSREPGWFDASEAIRFLQLLGKDPRATWFRTIKPTTPDKGANKLRKGRDLHGFDADALAADSAAGQNLYLVVGNARKATGLAIRDGDITECPAVFAEWDEGTEAEQFQTIRASGLPKPSVINRTGGRSLHAYWLLNEPISTEQWKQITRRLIAHTGSDPSCSNPSRVMRLPGSVYHDKATGKPTGRATIVSAPGHRYDLADLLEALPELSPVGRSPQGVTLRHETDKSRATALPTPAKRSTAAPSRQWEPRSIEEINEAAEYIPRRVGGQGTYVPDRNALCGCSAALDEAGAADPDGMALALLGHLWPDEAAARQVLKSTSTREAASFWAIAKEHGYNLKRTTQAPKAEQARTTEQPEASPHRPASLQALIQQLPDGWDTKTLKPQLLSAGRLDNMLPAAALRFNEMTLRAEVHTSSGWKQITDADIDSAYVVLSGKGWKVGPVPVEKAIIHNARQAPHHPVRAYLQQVEADPKIAPFDLNQVAPQFFRTNQPLHVAMVRKWLIGAVSRALNPGCQMDYVLVLQGGQGQLKSTSLGALASPDWYTSSVPENEKDLLLNIHSTWIYELAELESVTSRKESGRLKNLITTSTDLVRVPYGRTSERMERQSVFCATVNEDTFLRDDTGNRRFWVVPVEGTRPIDKAGLVAARDAIWKAAVAAYRAGELPMLPAELEALSSEQNQEFNQQDPWVEMVLAWMDGEPLHRWDPDRDPSTVIYDPSRPFTSAEILYSAGLRRLDQITRADEMRVAAVLRQLKFDRAQKRIKGRIDRFWLPSQPSQPSQPQGAEVVTPPTRSAAVDLGMPSQPSQPISTKKELRRKGHATQGADVICEKSLEKSPRGCDTLGRSVAPQSFQPSQPTFDEVVTPLEVVTPPAPAHGSPSTAAEWAEAALAALRLAPSITALPEVVAWVKAHPTSPGIAQAQLAGALDRLQREDREGDQLGLEVAA